MEEKIYFDENFDISKKLIDYHMEIEEYKYDLSNKQKVIDEKIINILQRKGVNEYDGDHCYVKLEIEEKKKINYTKYIEKLIKYGCNDSLQIKEGKKLLEYIINDEEAVKLYKKYKDKKNEDDKLDLIDVFKNNGRFDLLKFDLDDIKKIYKQETSSEKKEYFKRIIEDNQDNILIYDYIK